MKRCLILLSLSVLAAQLCFSGGGGDSGDYYPREMAIAPYANGFSKNPSVVWTFPKDHDYTYFLVLAFVDKNGDGLFNGLKTGTLSTWYLGESFSGWPSKAPASVLGNGIDDLVIHNEITRDNRYNVERTYKTIDTSPIPPAERGKAIFVVVATLGVRSDCSSEGNDCDYYAVPYSVAKSIRLDESPPTFDLSSSSIVVERVGANTNEATLSLRNAADVGGGLGGGSYRSYPDGSPRAFSLADTGADVAVADLGFDYHTFEVALNDQFGNATVKTITVDLRDLAPPILSFSSSAAGIAAGAEGGKLVYSIPVGNAASFTVSAADPPPHNSGVDLTSFACGTSLDGTSLAGSPPLSGNGYTVVKAFNAGSPSGDYEWTFAADDYSASSAPATPVIVRQRLLLAPPELSFTGLGEPVMDGSAPWYAVPAFQLRAVDAMGRAHAADPTATILFFSTDWKAYGDAAKDWKRVERAGSSWQGGPYAPSDETTYVTLGFADGRHRVDAKAADEAGNEIVRSIDFNVDTVPPALTIAVGGKNPGAYPGEAFYLSGGTAAIEISISDLTSGVASLSCAEDGVILAPLWRKNSASPEPVGVASVRFTPAEGRHEYAFAVEDAAGLRTSASVVVVHDPEPIAGDDIELRLTDSNAAATGRTTADAGNAVGNFSDLWLSVKVQNPDSAQPVSFSWSFDGAAGAGGNFASAPDGSVAALLAGGALAEGTHSVSVRVTDQAGNVSAPKAAAFTVDRTPPAVSKKWVGISDDGGNATVFTVNPVVDQGDDPNIRVYQTADAAYSADIAMGAKLLWNNGTVVETNGDAASGLFSLAGGVGAIHLASYDAAGNKAAASFTVLRPEGAPVPAPAKAVSADYSSFSVLAVAGSTDPVVIGGAAYTLSYHAVGVDSADGERAVSGATAVKAAGNPPSWDAAALGGGGAKAYEAGKLGFLKAWAVLAPPPIPEEAPVIALKRNGAPAVYRIPNSPPRFADEGRWPEYLGLNPAVAYPPAIDPDGHAVRYRFKTAAGWTTWYSDDKEGEPPSADWASKLNAGGTVTLQAWAGEGESWASDIEECSRSYEAGRIDFNAPEMTIGAPWSEAGSWTRASSFELSLADSGPSGLASAAVVFTPLNEDLTIDAASGRIEESSVPDGLSAGTPAAALPVALPPTLSGFYRLTATAVDRAGNRTLSSSKTARFDRGAPTLEAVNIDRPYDGASGRYFADSLGALSAAIEASDSQSGLWEWGYQAGSGGWVWSRMPNEAVSFTPPWKAEKNISVRFAVRDRVGNESAASELLDCRYDAEAPEFSLAVSGLPDCGYIGDPSSLAAVVSPSTVNAVWSLIRQNADGSETVSGVRDSWLQLVGDASLWVDGGRYRISASATNGNGVGGTRESRAFTLDRSAPTTASLTLVPPIDRGRSSYYRNEPFTVTVQDGNDAESPSVRVVKLFQTVGGLRTDLNAVVLGTGESQARVTWGTEAADWVNGAFFAEVVAANAAGLSTKSAAVPVPVAGEGLSVFLPAYNGGTGNLALSWNQGAASEIGSYRYRLWVRDQSDTPLGAETEESAAAGSALIDLSPFGLPDGAALYAVVASYDAEGALLSRGASTVSVVDKGVPEIRWTLVPEAVSSGRVWARFAAEGSASGAASAKWLIEKRSAGAEWQIVPHSAESDWRPFSGAGGGELVADLTGGLLTGDAVRLSILVENGAGRAAQITTGAMPVDDTPPPAPLVLDQGAAINHGKQPLRFNWQPSGRDTESGLSAYYYGWFFSGTATGPAVWTKAPADVPAATVDLRSLGASIEGKTAVLAVKAVNLAGLQTIGYSDGILLDGTAPTVFDMKAYSTADRTKELSGYVEPSSLSGKSVFLSIEAADGQSWVDGSSVSAYRWNADERTWTQEGAAFAVSGTSFAFALPASSAGFAEGSLWRFEGLAIDAAGNASAKAVSDGFAIEGPAPTVAKLQGFMDAASIKLGWDLGSTGSSRWVSHYAVTARWGGKVRTAVSTIKSASFSWGPDGLGLSNGDAVTFTVAALSFSGATRNSAQVADYELNLAIDVSPPEFDGQNTSIPPAAELTHFYDRIEGHAAYRANRAVSSLQWSAVLVPGEVPLTDWEEKRWSNQWDFARPLSSIDGEPLSSWHGKRIRFRFRAANSLGIWSEISTTEAIAVDASDPETIGLARASAFSNELNSVAGWTLSLGDADSGIFNYMTALVPTAQVSGANTADSYLWPETAENHAVEDRSPGALSTIDLSVPLAAASEGGFTPLVRVRNGSGRWVVRAGSPITMDRTAPSVTDLTWTGAPAQSLELNGTSRTVWVCNGPAQGLWAVADEAVKWTLSGPWFAARQLPASGYALAASSTLDFAGIADGELYPVTIALEDQAGNSSVGESLLRYNRAPAVSLKTEALTVRPGAAVLLEDLVSVADEEGSRLGDYPLIFSWTPGNGAPIRTWSGGADSASVFGSGGSSATFLQSGAAAQTSSYTGTLTVTDRYGKTTALYLPMTVENTRSGTLAADEYWSGPFELRGLVTVPAGKTLTLSGAEVSVKAPLSGGSMEGGILVRPGGALLIANPTQTEMSWISTGADGSLWRGVRVQGTLDGAGLGLSYAERALVLETSGSIRLSRSVLERNLIGLHLLGGTLDWSGWSIAENGEYGVKEDGEGTYAVRNSDFLNNGVDYYRHGLTRLSMDEINGAAGNGGNREVKR